MKLMLVDHLDSGEILLDTQVFESGQEGAVLLSRSIKYSFLVKYRNPTVLGRTKNYLAGFANATFSWMEILPSCTMHLEGLWVGFRVLLPKMVLVDMAFHYDGEWMLYERKLVHKWEGYDSDLLYFIDITNEYNDKLGYVSEQQLIVYVPTEKYYEIVDDEGIRTLLSFVHENFDAINLFVVEDSELDVDIQNIIKMKESVVVIDEVATDCTSADGTDNDSDTFSDNSEELEILAQERNRVIDCSFCDYKDLHRSLAFKEHKCDDLCGNCKVSATTIAFYFKEKLQANPKHKIKEMRVDLKTAFNINAHFEKCKRPKRMILENMEGSFCDDYKKLV
ncbi:hypothetical protein H5410_044994, partial [Solanum commersonii]